MSATPRIAVAYLRGTREVTGHSAETGRRRGCDVSAETSRRRGYDVSAEMGRRRGYDVSAETNRRRGYDVDVWSRPAAATTCPRRRIAAAATTRIVRLDGSSETSARLPVRRERVLADERAERLVRERHRRRGGRRKPSLLGLAALRGRRRRRRAVVPAARSAASRSCSGARWRAGAHEAQPFQGHELDAAVEPVVAVAGPVAGGRARPRRRRRARQRPRHGLVGLAACARRRTQERRRRPSSRSFLQRRHAGVVLTKHVAKPGRRRAGSRRP